MYTWKHASDAALIFLLLVTAPSIVAQYGTLVRSPVSITFTKNMTARTLDLHVYALNDNISGPATAGLWKALSVQFTGGFIERVIMQQGNGNSDLYVGIGGNVNGKHTFFQSADLSGAGRSWASGRAATVALTTDTDMRSVGIDYDSINTYVTTPYVPACRPSSLDATRCNRPHTTYFGKNVEEPDTVFASNWMSVYEHSMQVVAEVLFAGAFCNERSTTVQNGGTLRAWHNGELRGMTHAVKKHPYSGEPLYIMVVYGSTKREESICFDFVHRNGFTQKVRTRHIVFAPDADAGTMDAPLRLDVCDYYD